MFFLKRSFTTRVGNVYGSVTVNGCQTGFLLALFPVANWTKNVPSAIFPATANAVLFVGGAFPGVALLSPLTGLSKAIFFLTFAMRKHALFIEDVFFNRIAVKGLQPRAQRSRVSGGAEPTERRPTQSGTALAVAGMSLGKSSFALGKRMTRRNATCGSNHLLEHSQVSVASSRTLPLTRFSYLPSWGIQPPQKRHVMSFPGGLEWRITFSLKHSIKKQGNESSSCLNRTIRRTPLATTDSWIRWRKKAENLNRSENYRGMET